MYSEIKLGFTWLIVLSLLLNVLVVSLTPVTTTAEYSTWILLDPGISQRVALYDRDLDGEPEILAVDNRIYTNLTGNISTPTPTIPCKVDLNATGEVSLVLYSSTTGKLEVYYQHVSYVLSVLVNAKLEVHRWGLLVYNATNKSVIVAGKPYDIPGDLVGTPLLVDNKPLFIGSRGEGVVLYDLELRDSSTITLLNITVVEALYDESRGVVFGVGFTGTGLLYFEYNYRNNGGFTYSPLAISSLKQSVSTTRRIYVLTEGGVLYAITSGGNLTYIMSNVLALYYPADSVDSFVALTSESVVKITDSGDNFTIDEYSLPPVNLGEIYAVDWWGSVLAAATSRGVYVATTKPLYVVINAPVSTYAGESITVNVTGVYDSVVVNIAGRVYNMTGNQSIPFIFSYPGNFTVVATACRGVFCAVNTTSILVKQRPLGVRLSYPGSIKPYDPLTIFVETFDKLTNKSVLVSCSISDPLRRVYRAFRSGGNITVPAVPDVDSAVFTVTCGGREYEVVSATVRSKLTEPYLKIKLRYYGSGLLEVSGIDKFTGDAWRGLVRVEYLDLNITVEGENSALITLPLGSTRLNVSLVKNNVTYYAEELTVVYYEDVFMVPAGEAVIVADRVRVDVYTLTQTITRPFPVYHEIRVTDPLVVAATAAFTAGAVYAILMLLGKLPRFKREKT